MNASVLGDIESRALDRRPRGPSVLDNDHTHARRILFKKIFISYNMAFSRILLPEYYFGHMHSEVLYNISLEKQ
jgi:hypothetical protein